MVLRSPLNRIASLGCLLAVGNLGATNSAHAGPLCDWLFGRNTALVQPYAAGYPYAAAYPYAATHPPGEVAVTSVTALQMPAYGSYYPSAVYPGLAPNAAVSQPGDRGYFAYFPGPGGTYPVDGPPQTSFYGTGNVYPSRIHATPYSADYAANYPTVGVAPVTAYQVPVTPTPPSAAIPNVPAGVPGTTVQTHPGIPASSPGLLGGLGHFFGNLFGTNYNTSYYRAPVTYYRPVTTLDPTTGATTIVQRPCTSYEYQMQRSPYTSLSPAAPTYAPPACTSPAPVASYNPYAAPVTSSPVTSTSPTGGNAPLTTSPTNDLAPVNQPQLDSQGSSSYMAPVPSTAPAPTWYPSGVRSTSEPTSSSNLQAPALQSSSFQPTNDISSTHIRPLPAGDYPYPRQSSEMAVPLPIAPQQPLRPSTNPPVSNFPSTNPANSDSTNDRVAQGSSNDRLAQASGTPAVNAKPIQWLVRQAAHQTPAKSQPKHGPNLQQADPQQPTSRQVQTAPAASKSANRYEKYQSSGWVARP